MPKILETLTPTVVSYILKINECTADVPYLYLADVYVIYTFNINLILE